MFLVAIFTKEIRKQLANRFPFAGDDDRHDNVHGLWREALVIVAGLITQCEFEFGIAGNRAGTESGADLDQGLAAVHGDRLGDALGPKRARFGILDLQFFERQLAGDLQRGGDVLRAGGGIGINVPLRVHIERHGDLKCSTQLQFVVRDLCQRLNEFRIMGRRPRH